MSEFVIAIRRLQIIKIFPLKFIPRNPKTSKSPPNAPVLSNDSVDPCREGGLEPALLAGRELGFELPNDPPGVRPVLVGTEGFLCVYLPWLLSLSLSESGVDADNDDRDGRDMATDRWDFSRT